MSSLWEINMLFLLLIIMNELCNNYLIQMYKNIIVVLYIIINIHFSKMNTRNKVEGTESHILKIIKSDMVIDFQSKFGTTRCYDSIVRS